MKILVHRAGALGDFVLSLPVIAAAAAEHEVDVACDRRWWPLLDPLPVGRRWDAGGLESLWMHGGRDPVGYDLGLACSAVELPIRALRRVAPRPPPGMPAWRHFASLYPCDPGWRLPVAPLRADRPVVVAPGASTAAKVWPRWAEVAEALGAVLVGGPNEPGMAWRPGLAELAALFASASAVLASDSGPAHLAARVGARTAVVFGPTDPAVWCPHGASAFGWDVEVGSLVAWARARR